MSNAEAQSVSQASTNALQKRLRDQGVLLLVCSESGTLIPCACETNDWLEDLLTQSPLFTRALRRIVTQWSEADAPETCELIPGLWITPIPLINRRRRTGYALAMLPTWKFLDAEQLVAMCQSAQMDLQLCKRLLAQLPPIDEREVSRLTDLIRFAHENELRMQAGHLSMTTIGQQLAESYEEINLLYTITQSMIVEQQPEQFVKMACEELLETLPYLWIGAQFADDDESLKRLARQFIVAGKTAHPAKNVRAQALAMFDVAEPEQPLVLERLNGQFSFDVATFGRAALVHPVSIHNEVVGLLIAGEKQGEDTAASSVDMKLLGATASHMSIFLQNAALYDDLQAMFLGTLEALTASIDAKDRYTCGHSQRVAQLTEQLALAIGMDERTAHRMRIAGLVHDVGKIGVPEAVLTKPGRLTDEEFAWIRMHPEIGHRILKDIPQLRDILPGVLYHHERWDGRGYPHGLKGKEIPLVGRLIALADSFDAMSSTRTYRSRLSRPEVLSEIQRCAGSQFDPNLVPAFIRLDFAEFDQLVSDHQAEQSPIKSLEEHGREQAA